MLNKRECRKLANPGLKMAAGSGLLRAGQIDYIIRTAVKIIDRHKTLVLYVYSRVQAAQGDFRPHWTVFQGKDDFITLERREDGSAVWRKSAFDSLGGRWGFTGRCAFYSAKDEERVTRYLKSSRENGMDSLVIFQWGIQEKRRQERQRIREREIINRMECVPALPRSLKSWIHKSVMPAYFFYDYKRGGTDVPGVCSSCGHEIRLSNVKMGNKGICPHCMHGLVMKPRSRRGYCMTDRDTCQVIQNTGSGGLVIRIIKARYRHVSGCLDETQDRTHRILRIAAEDAEFLHKLDANVDMLKAFQEYAGVKDRQRLFLWQLKHKVKLNIPPILTHMTVHKFIRYMEKQYSFLCLRKTPHGSLRYKEMQDLVTEYRDYLDMCRRMGYDMKNSFVLYPKDLQKSHDKTARRMKHKKDAEIKRGFTAVYKQLAGQLDFEKDGLKIVYPDAPDDVIAEGHALHHCVGSYTERVAEKECVILFLRRCADVSKPFYTIEVRGQEVVQVRGIGNCGMTPEVEAFVAAWKQRALCAPLPAAA